MTAGGRAATMRSVIRYRILIEGGLTSRLVGSIGAVAFEPHGAGMDVHVDVSGTRELDALLQPSESRRSCHVCSLTGV
jgi:hypothetical protein